SWAGDLNLWETVRRERLNESYMELMRGFNAAEDRNIPFERPMIRQLESKYVSDGGVVLHPPTYRDIVQVIIGLPKAREVLFDITDDVSTTDYDGVFQAINYVLEAQCEEPCQKHLFLDKPVRPAFMTDDDVTMIERSFELEAAAARFAGRNSDIARRLVPQNAPSIRTVINSAGKLLQQESFSGPLQAFNDASPADATTFSKQRFMVTLIALDRLVVNAYEYVAE
ncbi:MAG: hypothetical protein AAFR01_09765, partial [Pseudomonadota bacterium]